MYVENKVRIFYEINPKPERKGIALPRVDHLGIGYAVLQSLVVHKVEHIFDSERKRRAAMGSAEYGLEQVVDKFL